MILKHKAPSDKLHSAVMFAAGAHMGVGQIRKYTGEPYIVHPLEVANILYEYFPEDEALQIAAILHDVIEDTKVTDVAIATLFGSDVAALVLEVTDISKPTDGNRKTRKEIDRIHISKASLRGKNLKLADLISNSATITQYDPKFARVYMAEKKELLEVLQDGQPELLQRAEEIVSNYYADYVGEG